MALGLSFGSSSKKATAVTTTDQEVDRQRQTAVNQAENKFETGREVTTSTKRELDDETVALLTQLLQTTASGFASAAPATGSAEAKLLATQLATRAGDAEAAIRDDIAKVVAGARLRGEQELGRAKTQLATAAGSSQNTLVQRAVQESRADLETQLGELAGRLGIEARGAATSEFGQALGGLLGVGQAAAGEGQALAQLTAALRGAVTTTTGETATTKQSQQLLNALEAISELVTGKTTETAQSKAKSKSFGLSL